MVFFVSQLWLKVQNANHHMINQLMPPPRLFKAGNTSRAFRGFSTVRLENTSDYCQLNKTLRTCRARFMAAFSIIKDQIQH